ncbi:UDP-glucose:undecaprenyl-phosphate glucose-1-phosphate transferase [Rubripirellula lacrimiformis]|uniref:UDP-glucose:undecaprenyl-phosphate glucose-1-phosphate transferase n=1 Tax=Rubripirellula lacrimiformis TaxID=1930273 RepID=A0A517NFK7_9BACT|nr:exopolysaccharide biosynthesis polyprenyl glycosylphosphotransferase [Rubripirellula lacrimiformis]QDT05895.1 UDP-glucose:undecaprenyl-phosphate glucose-1-phosphate transferase [Rubripirellula lacrimiformis]
MQPVPAPHLPETIPADGPGELDRAAGKYRRREKGARTGTYGPGSSTGPNATGPNALAEPSVQVDAADAVVANHTASKIHAGLSRAYTVQSVLTGLPLAIVDTLVTAFTFVAASFAVSSALGMSVNSGMWIQLPVLLSLQLALIALHQLYPGAGVSPVYELRGLVRSTVMALLFLSGMNLTFGQLPRSEFAVFAIAAIAISLSLPLARHLAREVLSKTKWWGIRTLLVGKQGECGRICERMLHRRSSGFVMVGYVARHRGQQDLEDVNCLGTLDDAFAIACRRSVPVAAIASCEVEESAHRMKFQFPSLVWMGHSAAAQDSSDVLGAFTKRLNMPFLRFVPRLCKRGLDLMIVVPGLLALTPFIAAVAIAIKWQSPGPVIYGSGRVGQHGRRFKMWKFRSMVVNADEVLKQKLASDPIARSEWAQDSKLKNDPRIIPGVGHFLRRWSLDELPQLWNVLVGEMSLVGPRPVLPHEIVRYQNRYYEYTHMWPGLTGLWQVSGRNETTFETRVFLVHHYASNWSLWLDAWILVKTPLTVLTRRGAY